MTPTTPQQQVLAAPLLSGSGESALDEQDLLAGDGIIPLEEETVSEEDRQQEEEEDEEEERRTIIQTLSQRVSIWAGFLTAPLLVYFWLSGGDFSFLMAYGAMARMFGFGILDGKVYKSQRSTGVSIKALQLYFLVFFCRIASIVTHEGYLPYDMS